MRIERVNLIRFLRIKLCESEDRASNSASEEAFAVLCWGHSRLRGAKQILPTKAFYFLVRLQWNLTKRNPLSFVPKLGTYCHCASGSSIWISKTLFATNDFQQTGCFFNQSNATYDQQTTFTEGNFIASMTNQIHCANNTAEQNSNHGILWILSGAILVFPIIKETLTMFAITAGNLSL